MLDEIKNIFSESVVLPHFLISYNNDRSVDFAYILEGLIFLDSLIQRSDDLGQYDRYCFIIQTVGHHLQNYLTYNRRTPDQLSVILASTRKNYAGGAQKHMELIALDVLRCLYNKNGQLTLEATAELPPKQIDYILQIANEYDPQFGADLTSFISQQTGGHQQN